MTITPTTPATLRPSAVWALEALRTTRKPVKASELLRVMRQRHGVRIARGTVYRALADLDAFGLATSEPEFPRRWVAAP